MSFCLPVWCAFVPTTGEMSGGQFRSIFFSVPVCNQCHLPEVMRCPWIVTLMVWWHDNDDGLLLSLLPCVDVHISNVSYVHIAYNNQNFCNLFDSRLDTRKYHFWALKPLSTVLCWVENFVQKNVEFAPLACKKHVPWIEAF